MPKRKKQRFQIVIESYECPVCGAAPSRRCETYNGNPKREPHAERSRLAEQRGWRAADDVAEFPGPTCVHCRNPMHLWQGIWVDGNESISCLESPAGHHVDPWADL